MRWQDVDLDTGWWTIPAASSKNKLPHRVPLNAPVIALLAARLVAAHKDDTYVLEAHHRIAGAGARGRRQQYEASSTFLVDDFAPHDLRRTAASLMTSGGVPRLTVSKILNHKDRGITAVYDRHTYDPEKRAALDWWAVKLQAIIDNRVDRKVLAFGR
jgi:integrase